MNTLWSMLIIGLFFYWFLTKRSQRTQHTQHTQHTQQHTSPQPVRVETEQERLDRMFNEIVEVNKNVGHTREMYNFVDEMTYDKRKRWIEFQYKDIERQKQRNYRLVHNIYDNWMAEDEMTYSNKKYWSRATEEEKELAIKKMIEIHEQIELLKGKRSKENKVKFEKLLIDKMHVIHPEWDADKILMSKRPIKWVTNEEYLQMCLEGDKF